MSSSSNPPRGPAAQRRSNKRETTKERLAARREAELAAAAAAKRKKRLFTYAAAAAVVVVALVVGLIVGNNSPDDSVETDTTVAEGFPDSTRDDNGVEMVADDATDPVTVELYVDLQCPACREYEARVGGTIEELVIDGRVRLVVHPIAILDRMSSTDYSTRASAATACAADEWLYWAHSKVLYAEQPPEGGDGLTNERLVELGAEVGLSSPEFATCVTDQTEAPWTAQITDAARAAEISGTPTILVDGEQLSGGEPEDLTEAVDAAADPS